MIDYHNFEGERPCSPKKGSSSSFGSLDEISFWERARTTKHLRRWTDTWVLEMWAGDRLKAGATAGICIQEARWKDC